MKFAYVTSISPGYMFALNANFNSNSFYDVNADYIVLYSHMDNPYEQEYMKKCSEAFPFKVTWIPMGDHSHCFHNSKYSIASTLKDEYDAICLIDADLFICCNTLEWFNKAAVEKKFITATHLWSGGIVENMPFGKPELMDDRSKCQLADFPVFIDPKMGEEFFKQWKRNTEDNSRAGDWTHPLIAFNRAICQFFTREQVIGLPGDFWVCDSNYWGVLYTNGIDESGKICMNTDVVGSKMQVCALHNKWWKLGRSSGEWLAHRWVVEQNNVEMMNNLDRGQSNFANIRDFMMIFNDMTPSTRRDDFYSGKHDWRKYLETGEV